MMPTPSSYDRFKEFHGKRYTGMQVGRRHKWRYDAGEWSEQKVTPDRWTFRYAVTKRRAGRAPEGSGAPVGTGYRWYILATQVVTKQDANSYTTEMEGVKFKLAHKRADKGTWSASEAAQRRALVKLLREMIGDLEAGPIEAAGREEVTGDGAARPAPGDGATDGARKTTRRSTTRSTTRRPAHAPVRKPGAHRPAARTRPARPRAKHV